MFCYCVGLMSKCWTQSELTKPSCLASPAVYSFEFQKSQYSFKQVLDLSLFHCPQNLHIISLFYQLLKFRKLLYCLKKARKKLFLELIVSVMNTLTPWDKVNQNTPVNRPTQPHTNTHTHTKSRHQRVVHNKCYSFSEWNWKGERGFSWGSFSSIRCRNQL